jgi:hypothetical protein
MAMNQELSQARKQQLLTQELSNVGHGLLDPVGIDTLEGYIKQKSVVIFNAGRANGSRNSG